MTLEANCPECDAPLSLIDPVQGEILPCPECGVDLEVISLTPLVLDIAPEVAEDWGE